MNACWLWTGSTARGYGKVTIKGRNYLVHRLVYEVLVGPIPEGYEVDHLCFVRNCYNPAHMEAVTKAENVRRGVKRNSHHNKTHCIRGHPLSGENVRLRISRYGRACRACERERRFMAAPSGSGGF